eukprot:TRINITY_DN31773_c0_g1_i2.p1 TRINITY_DN31773_c0_g1~~TRINITY_DN31773_c0_g1_i2.p1  ORF type:complete len:187 (+),score=18.24 TRINITY_DN31773_c0_g1_i2:45-563(+)
MALAFFPAAGWNDDVGLPFGASAAISSGAPLSASQPGFQAMPRDCPIDAIWFEWSQRRDQIDTMLRGPLESRQCDPSWARCRLCGRGLCGSGNVVSDDLTLANRRLVAAMDAAWEAAEYFYASRGALQQCTDAQRSKVERLHQELDQLRLSMPQRIRTKLNRALGRVCGQPG